MQTYWQAPQNIRRWVLAWLLMAAVAAVASPLVRPRAMELACAGAGHTVLLEQTADGLAPADAPALDCPLCLPADVPPPAVARTDSVQPVPVQAEPRKPWRVATHFSRHRPPARAPPFFTEPS
jgi:hypothetical protein